MRIDEHGVLSAASRFYAPLTMLFGVTLVLIAPPGSGVGFIAGLAFSLVLVLQVIVRGAAVARKTLPPWAARLALGAGLVLAIAGAGAPRLALSGQMIEAGAFLSCIAMTGLVALSLAGRVPAMLSDTPE